MNKIEYKFNDSLNRINFIFKNEEIYVECVKDHHGFSVLGEKFGPFEKGKKYRLKFFIAVPFIKNNILRIANSDKCDNVDLQRYAIEERDEQKLTQREIKNFLNKIKEFHLFMEKNVKDNNIPQKFLDDFKSYNISVIDSRLLKILRLAKSELSPEVERRLTDSERLLYNHIHRIIDKWRGFFLNLRGMKD